MIKPKILISACLEFENVRYNGQLVPSKIVRDLIPFADFIKVCPENEIGLGVPREPIRIVKKGGEPRLIQHKTERDVTDEMNFFSENFVNNIKEVDGFILKSKSPTMGVQNIKIYSGIERGSSVIDKCGGFFADKINKKYCGYPIEEDDRLRNRKIRDHFLTKVFLFARFREAEEKKKLEFFHQQEKLLLNFYNRDLSAKLDPKKNNYFSLIKEIVQKPPDSKDITTFFENIMIGKKEMLEKYKQNKASLETVKELSKIFIKDKKLLTQSFYNPFPEELILDVEEDRDKDYWKHNKEICQNSATKEE